MSGGEETAARRLRVVGRSVDKVDAFGLATGRARFTADLAPPGTLVAKILESPHPHARIRRIDARAARALPGVHAVLTWEDVPRVAYTTAGQGYPEPSPYDSFMLDNKVRFVGDRVAAVAAESAAVAREACRLIEVEYEELEPVLDPRDAMRPGAPVIHDEPECRVVVPVPFEPERNLAASVDAAYGDLDAALAASDAVVKAEFETQYAQHCPIETHVCLANVDAQNRIVIHTSTQVPFHVRRIVAARLQVPVRRVHVIKPRIGGGFGAKQEVLIEDITAMLAIVTDRPVLLELTRAEEFYASRTRHPQLIRMKMGARRDGTLTGADLHVLMNTGAYGGHALTVVCNSGSKVLPLYRWDAVRFAGRSVYTNLPVGGAYRGYGVTQTAFANEVLVDELAHALAIDPLTMRLLNHIREGDSSPIFAALGEGKPGVAQTVGSCKLADCLRQGAEAIGWQRRRGAPSEASGDEGPVRRGIGMAALMQGSSIPEIDMGACTIKLNEDGSFNLLVGATDLGTGSDTVLAQIAAEVLGVEVDQIVVRSSDTDVTPFDVGAYASSTTYLSGNAVKKAALEVHAQIQSVASAILNLDAKSLRLVGGEVVSACGQRVSLGEVALRSLYEVDQRQIGAMASHISHKSPPPFAAHFAEVEVDVETGRVTVLKYVAAVDCGRAIHPRLAEGQTEGAVLNGISYALTEEFLFDGRGRMVNPSFRSYKIFSAADLPEVRTILVESEEPTGPFGAKSVSEISINGPLPAISNAIFNATGVRLRQAPFTAERVLRALRETRTPAARR
jgi:putative selenate reductase molybdopterin-binding subunit